MVRMRPRNLYSPTINRILVLRTEIKKLNRGFKGCINRSRGTPPRFKCAKMKYVIYQEHYRVYENGSIKSMRLREVFLKPWDNGKGYPYVKINDKSMAVHRVVSECYLGDKPDGYTVNHIDGDKTNNHRSNLEYITREENYQHALRHGLKRNIESELTETEQKNLVWLYKMGCYTQKELAESVGFDRVIFKKLLKKWA